MHDREPAGDHPLESLSIDHVLETSEREWLVEAEPEHQPLLRLRARIELLQLAWRASRARASVAAARRAAECADVATDRGTVSAPLLPESRHRPDPDTEVVAALPVA